MWLGGSTKQTTKVHRNSSRMPGHNRAPLFKSTRPLDHINKQIKSLLQLQLHHFYFENMTNNCKQQRDCLMRESLYMHKVPPAWWVINFTSNDTCRIHSAQNLMKPFFLGTAFLNKNLRNPETVTFYANAKVINFWLTHL